MQCVIDEIPFSDILSGIPRVGRHLSNSMNADGGRSTHTRLPQDAPCYHSSSNCLPPSPQLPQAL